MRRRALWLLCACAFLLPSCSQDTKAPEGQSPRTTTTRSSNDAEQDDNGGGPGNDDATSGGDATSDAALLRTLLGSTGPTCPEGTPPGNALCLEVLNLSADLVGYVDVALKSMPKTSAYKNVSKAVDNFDTAYKNARTCYKPGAEDMLGKGPKVKRLCSAVVASVEAAWYGLEQAIRDLEQSG